MRRTTALVGIVLALMLSISAQEPARPPAPQAGQQPAPPDAPGAPQQTPAGEPAPAQPIFRTGINFVRVDVIVTDRQGNPVADLQQSDFEVTEDGKPQTVESFKLVKIDTVPQEYTSRTIRTREDEETAAADENSRIFVFFLDDYNVRLGNSMSARKPVADFVRNQLAPNDLVAVMYPLTPLDAVVLTRNHEGVIRTIERFEGRKFRYEPRNDIEQRYADQPTEVVERIRRQVSLSALKGLSIKLGALREGRKAIVLLSEGYTAMLPPQMRDAIAGFTGLGNPNAGNPFAGENNLQEDRARNMAEMDLQTELQLVFDAANRTNTAIYAVDPRGLSTGEFDIQDNINQRTSQEALRSTMASLQILAENTDGRAIVNRNDLAKGMEQIVRDSSAYYLVGYNSTQAPQDGKFHAIRVRIKRPGVQVRARKGYWALTAEETARATAPPKAGPPPAVTKAFASITPSSGGRRYVRTWYGAEPGDDGRTTVTFLWEPIPAPPGMKREAAKQVSLVASSPSGEEYFSGPVGDMTSGSKGASVSFAVKPGRVRLRMAVEGDAPGALDSEDREITVPDLTSPDVRVATPRVFVARTAREYQQLKAEATPTPTALREFRRAERLVVRFNASGKTEGPVALAARLLNKQGQKMTDLPVNAAEAGLQGQVDLPLSSLAVGDYVLEVSANSEGQQPSTELVAFRVVG
jgi:VWFA-related protein